MGFVTTSMEFVQLHDGRLLVVSKSDYKDQSGHRDQDHVEFFIRKDQTGLDAESVAAKAVLKKVAETYRTISAARFESETFTGTCRTTERSAADDPQKSHNFTTRKSENRNDWVWRNPPSPSPTARPFGNFSPKRRNTLRPPLGSKALVEGQLPLTPC